jgi:hypothetical protein
MLETPIMSASELKKLVDQTTASERLFLEHYLAHLRRLEDREYAEEIARRQRQMDKGRKISWKDVKKLHSDLLKQGL